MTCWPIIQKSYEEMIGDFILLQELKGNKYHFCEMFAIEK